MKPKASTPPMTPKKIRMKGSALPWEISQGLTKLSMLLTAEAPEQHEHRPAGRIVLVDPDGRGSPDQRRAHRHDRHEEGQQPEQHRARHARDQEADARHHALHQRGAEDPVHHAANGVDRPSASGARRAAPAMRTAPARTRLPSTTPSRNRKNAIRMLSASSTTPFPSTSPLVSSQVVAGSMKRCTSCNRRWLSPASVVQ